MDKLEKGPILLDNFLTKSEIDLFLGYTVLMHRQNDANMDRVNQVPNFDTSYYSDPLTETLLVCKTKLLEETLGYKLWPTYTYWRMYTFGSQLLKHTDRPSCEISMTIHVGGDKEWPIILGDKELTLKPGQGAIYKGIDWPHYRKDAYDGDHYSQIFMHWVKREGSFSDFRFDGRPRIGLKKQ